MPENVNTSSLAAAVEDLSEDNRRTMVKVDHVSMIFNMASEQLNSLKEYAIQIARRKLFFEGFTALDVNVLCKRGCPLRGIPCAARIIITRRLLTT